MSFSFTGKTAIIAVIIFVALTILFLNNPQILGPFLGFAR